MHRWHFFRFIRWLIPVVVLLAALCLIVVGQKNRGVGLAFGDDAAYLDVLLAQNLIEHGSFGLNADHAIMAVRDVLWRLLLAVAGLLTGDFMGSAYLLGAVFSIATVLICLRMVRMLFPFPPFIFYTALLLMAAPGLVASSVSGSSESLATALICGACLLHIEGLIGRRHVLPLASAFLLGLAMWIRIEFFVFWLVFFLHALFMTLFMPRAERSIPYVVVRAISGFLILSLCVMPLLAWNYGLMRIPWPQAIGAPFTMDLWNSMTPVEALQKSMSLSLEAVPAAFRRLLDIPFLKGWLERLVAVVGLALISGLSIRHREERPYLLLLFLAIFVPLIYALLYPYLGWGGASILFQTLSPLFVVAAAFVVFRAPFLAEAIYRKWKPGLPEAPGFKLWWLGMGLILILFCLFRTGSRLSQRLERLVEADAARKLVEQTLSSHAAQGILTDQPGWIAFRLHVLPLDLSGETDPYVLTCLESGGQLSREKIKTWIDEQSPGSIVLWNRNYDAWISSPPYAQQALPLSPLGPKVWIRSRSGVL
ncbi:MAG TPA: hypothetical protein DCZ95_19270 [Verrucomicrobia bacterium]|nr:MAG: hypothetical protein A2X46_13390 [Lentisphaerae bacterium GWF2_57_35]HBA86228.1 hypothetical protein [Verrucomicrobiota bacterium]